MTHKQAQNDIRGYPGLEYEMELWAGGCAWVGGLDEAGRGAWAGPVCAGLVVLPRDAGILERLKGVRDSKQMSAAQRGEWAERIRAEAAAWQVGFASPEEIDALNIVNATRLAMRRALAGCRVQPDHLLIDALRLTDCELPQTAIVKGDAQVLSIAAASVLAKTARDRLMADLDLRCPGYGFARHKGYGTAQHQEALRRLGPCPEHRRSFAPVAGLS